ncbi:zinc finger protein 831-like [Stylonychia lemnae]|uniref:Zinc finger protein 831-like n=1 Tax=Stylonychia lemnae TaxID=5949 RepID=A0A078AS08_STYLE|nr:zinc finger protein 831-like [Stylonychia lemnae]|eukprot:CDW83668.1 zinc finger protein 831-like [Stylonychia lemnae]
MQPYFPPIYPQVSLSKPSVIKPTIKRNRSINGKGKFECPHCSRRCQSQHAMDNHVRVHTGEKPFPCLVPGCDKFFKQKSQQYSHMRNSHNYNTDLLKNAKIPGSSGPQVFLNPNSNNTGANPNADTNMQSNPSNLMNNSYSLGLDPNKIAIDEQFQMKTFQKVTVKKEDDLVSKVYQAIKKRTKEKYIKQKENEDILQSEGENEDSMINNDIVHSESYIMQPQYNEELPQYMIQQQNNQQQLQQQEQQNGTPITNSLNYFQQKQNDNANKY